METKANQSQGFGPQAFLVRLKLHYKNVDRFGDLYVLIRTASELEDVVENLDFDVRVLHSEIVALDSDYGTVELGRFQGCHKG